MTIFHDALDKVFGSIGNAAISAGNHINDAIDNVLNFSTNHYAQAETVPQPAPAKKNSVDYDKMLAAIRNNETGAEKDPYNFFQDSGSKVQGRALGAYQVTDGEYQTYGKKFLGKDYTPDQFLASSTLQDTYMRAKIKHGEEDLQLTPAQILATHRGGYTNPDKAMVKYKDYVDKGMKIYNQ